MSAPCGHWAPKKPVKKWEPKPECHEEPKPVSWHHKKHHEGRHCPPPAHKGC
ncbi:hypothetical protein LWC33_01030 [Pseudonocardia sp. RS11V-5]|uniref:hypothetical protein n=1 Tax=Pseudonocardia terrae TaxID=2905831 RepID=UPI001E4EB7CF|nr:hypothetical protein [Pseudonocardia terrae]MCE3550036.1 hypothetical protein [Pseudonocardia terrae]